MKFVSVQSDGAGWTVQMEGLILAALFLVILYVLWRALGRGSRSMTEGGEAPMRRPRAAKCPWQACPGQSRGTLTAWQCESCGVTAYSARRGPPRACKRDLKSRPL